MMISDSSSLNNKPHLVVLGGIWPTVTAVTEAACMVTYKCLEQLAQDGTLRISYCLVNMDIPKVPEGAKADLTRLEEMGVTICPPVTVRPNIKMRQQPLKTLWYVLTNRQDELQQGMGSLEDLYNAINGKPDAFLPIWAEPAINLVSRSDVALFAFAGNLSFRVHDAGLTLKRLGEGKKPGLIGQVLDKLAVSIVRAGHMKMMRRYTHVFEVAANDAAFYQDQQISAEYLPNVWSLDNMLTDWSEQRDASERLSPAQIVVSVGNQDATGNSFAFYTLTKEVLPALKRQLGEGTFELHVFGGRQPRPFLREALQDPHIVFRGFVDDLESELLASPVFLLPHNHEKFKVGHTRVLQVWSLGGCVVAFKESQEPMPELQHNENALLADTADEMAQHVSRALSDRNLRRTLGQNGIATLSSHNNPSLVYQKMVTGIKERLLFGDIC